MVTRVVPVRARAAIGDTVMVRGHPAVVVVVDLLPRDPGHPRSALPRLRAQPAVRGTAAPLAMP